VTVNGNQKPDEIARGETEKKPVGWDIPYYDIEGMRKYVDQLQPNEEVVLTEKIHGANAAFCHDGKRIWVKSRNYFKRDQIEIPVFEDYKPNFFLIVFHFIVSLIWNVYHKISALPKWNLFQFPKRIQVGKQTIPSTDQWWDVARRYDLVTKLAQYPGLVFFGEVYGQVKGFRYDAQIEEGVLRPRVRFFDIWDLKQMRYLDYDDFLTICQSAGLDTAPELYRGQWLGKEKMYPYAEGKTTLGGGHVREGFVLRTVKERYDDRLGRMQVKLVGEGYNLQK
jgi:RNA ligase (TIGR02306 family)